MPRLGLHGWLCCVAMVLPCHVAAAQTLGDLITGSLPTESIGANPDEPAPMDATVPTLQVPAVREAAPLSDAFFEQPHESETEALLRESSPLRQATMLQQTPFAFPRRLVSPDVPTQRAAEVEFTSRVFRGTSLGRGLRAPMTGQPSFSIDLIRGAEAAPRATTDLGSLLKKSSSALSIQVQNRSPIVSEARVRGSRIGAQPASGSYWVPARADLDTAVSKIDSRQIRDVAVIPGPFSSLYGPGFHFIDFLLETSPRYSGRRRTQGSTSFEHKSNGNQWLGQQTLMTGSQNWGLRGSYTHRLGSNYRAGNGDSVPADYESRALTVAYGRDFSETRTAEFSLLRLDQSDVEFPGFVFDINSLVTDGYEITYLDDDSWLGDRSQTEIWYNRTDFRGDAQNPAKAGQFPFLDELDFIGFTDVDSMSTGYRQAFEWGDPRSYQVTIGHDLRFIKEEVSETFQAFPPGGGVTPIESESLVPRSFSVNPGLFLEYLEPFLDVYTFKSGARVDYVQTDIVTEASRLASVGFSQVPYANAVGTDVSQTDRVLWSLFGTLERDFGDDMTGNLSIGYAQRPPTLTELYAVQTLLLVVQNGLNGVTGDPLLKSEKMLQLDLSFDYQGDRARCGVRGFHGWGFDYITFENTLVVVDAGLPQQVSLRYVNTSLATLTGLESYLELMPNRRLSWFGNLRMIDGRDRTRNGDFATTDAFGNNPSRKVPGRPRGFFNMFVGGADSEPLPGISPVEARVGVRLRDDVARPRWNIELAARIVDNQDRVATSLLETPTPGFTTWNLRGTWNPDRSGDFRVFAGIENFTDKTYREHLDFRSPSGVAIFQPGVNFYLGTDLQY